MALVHPVYTYHDHCLKYSADNFSTSKYLTHYYRLILHLAATTGISTLTLLLLTVRGTQGVTFCRFTAESDAAAKEQYNPDRLWPN
ncbi:hypothetical protein [Xenorhabdus bovienii]|uniref:hypothetical protein n=1 Tax=Xenorhabdus bovienii TaxID=40576 RepID=UPI000B252741|nr:hypothetical protein [Xenorhabdus bovienii]